MQSVPSAIIARLDLVGAARREADVVEPLMPTQPGTAELKTNAQDFADWLAEQLRAGLTTCSGLIVAVAKPETASRPVAVWGFAERVTYRALTELLMTQTHHQVDRSNEAYRTFAGAPLVYAQTRGPRPDARGSGLIWPDNAAVAYVVKADIASFYDYVDHDSLAQELLLRTREHATIQCLLDLLLEVQGRRYGIPQLLQPSDLLSDLYGDRVLRALRRKQWPSWRYNDDFRIAAESFEDVKRALDDLTAAARDNGLVLNESKTRTPEFSTYWEENVESDYVDHIGDRDPRWAIATLNATITPRDLPSDRDGYPQAEPVVDLPSSADQPIEQINLHEANRGTVRSIRHALIRLSDLAEPRAATVMPKMENIVAFVASATPYVLQYLQAMDSIDRDAVNNTITAIVDHVSLSDWQRMCLIRTVRELGLAGSAPFTAWVTSHRAQRYEAFVRAEATLALAEADKVDAQVVIRALDEEPSALASWYLLALRSLHHHHAIPETYNAVRDDNGLHAAILAAP